jgi:predicted lipoprotein with Yx(FWY)xxD motif
MNSKLYIVIGILVLIVGGYLLMKNQAGYMQKATANANSSASSLTVMPTATPVNTVTTEAVISVVTDPKFGKILVGASGMTLYAYSKDSADTVTCTGQCAVNWPPLSTQGKPVLGNGVNPDMVGTAQLTDGSKVVTYNHSPLYNWANDHKAGDVTGQGVGGVWFVVSPDGKMIKM